MMMDMTFATAYGFALILIAIILGILTVSPEKNSAYRRGQN